MCNLARLIFLFVACEFACMSGAAQAAAPFDVVIVNGHIIDGTGSPWYSGEIGIRAGRIVAIGNLDSDPRKQARTQIIDAKGQCILPGLIDAHTHPVWAGDRVHEFSMKVTKHSRIISCNS